MRSYLHVDNAIVEIDDRTERVGTLCIPYTWDTTALPSRYLAQVNIFESITRSFGQGRRFLRVRPLFS